MSKEKSEGFSLIKEFSNDEVEKFAEEKFYIADLIESGRSKVIQYSEHVNTKISKAAAAEYMVFLGVTYSMKYGYSKQDVFEFADKLWDSIEKAKKISDSMPKSSNMQDILDKIMQASGLEEDTCKASKKPLPN